MSQGLCGEIGASDLLSAHSSSWGEGQEPVQGMGVSVSFQRDGGHSLRAPGWKNTLDV